MNNELIIESLFFVLSNPLKQSDLKKIFDNGDTTTVVDINGKQMALKGLKLGDSELVDLLNLAGASYDPITVHDPSKGKDPTKTWEVVKADPWGHDRVA